MGAPHNLDLPLVFGRDRAPGVTGDGMAHHALAAAMQTAWATSLGQAIRTTAGCRPGRRMTLRLA